MNQEQLRQILDDAGVDIDQIKAQYEATPPWRRWLAYLMHPIRALYLMKARRRLSWLLKELGS